MQIIFHSLIHTTFHQRRCICFSSTYFYLRFHYFTFTAELATDLYYTFQWLGTPSCSTKQIIKVKLTKLLTPGWNTNDNKTHLKPIVSIPPPRENESDKQNDVFSFPGYYLFVPAERAGPSFSKHDAEDSGSLCHSRLSPEKNRRIFFRGEAAVTQARQWYINQR